MTLNPKDAIAFNRVPFSTIPAPFIAEIGVGMLEGALKYGRHNYRAAGVLASVYYDAAFRHLMKYWEGEWLDADSGLPHVVKAACCLAIIHDCTLRGNITDDRPPTTDSEWQKRLNSLVADMRNKHPDAKAPVTQDSAEKWNP